MQAQIMNKNELGLIDSVQNQQDGSSNQLISCHLRSTLNSSRIEKSDQSTMTDQSTCNCASDIIPKLKQKAHKSYMQVIQIQSLYKEQIQQMKNFYEQSLKSKDKKFKIKQDVLNQRCKQLQAEIRHVKQNFTNHKLYQISADLESPFQSDSIDNIITSPLLQDNNESIYNIRQFIQTPNLRDSSCRLQSQVNTIITQMRKSIDQKVNIQENNLTDVDLSRIQLIQKFSNQIAKIFNFINTMIQNTVQAHQKYNELVQVVNQVQNKYNKLHGIHEAALKQSKFMSDHIKKISQQKTKMEKKNSQLEKTIKNQHDDIKLLKKFVSSKQIENSNEPHKKQFDCLSSQALRDECELELQKGKSLLSSKIERKNLPMTRSASNQNQNKILPRSLNFKKKQQILQRQ